MSQNNEDYIPSQSFDRFSKLRDAREKQDLEELEQMEAALKEAVEPKEEAEEPQDDFQQAYSEVELRAHDAKAAAQNTAWAQKRYNEAKKAKEERDQARKEAEDLKRQLADANRRKPEIPIDEWAETNPESAAQVDARIYNNNTIIQEELDSVKQELAALKAQTESQEEAQMEIAAMQALESKVPGAGEILTDPEFDAWLSKRPTAKNIIEGTLDVDSAEEVLNMYKYSKVANTPERLQEKQEQEDIEAAAEAIRTPNGQPEMEPEKKIWKESELAALSLKEYAKYEAEIDLAFTEGRYINDLTA